MPLYYTINKGSNHTTNGSGGTESEHLRLLTVANQRSVVIDSVTTLGMAGGLQKSSGIAVLGKVMSTASTGGTALIPRPRASANNIVAATTVFTDASAITQGTPASNPYVLLTGCSIGGPGQWYPSGPDGAVILDPNGGANGNVDFLSISSDTSLTFRLTVDFAEGL